MQTNNPRLFRQLCKTCCCDINILKTVSLAIYWKQSALGTNVCSCKSSWLALLRTLPDNLLERGFEVLVCKVAVLLHLWLDYEFLLLKLMWTIIVVLNCKDLEKESPLHGILEAVFLYLCIISIYSGNKVWVQGYIICCRLSYRNLLVLVSTSSQFCKWKFSTCRVFALEMYIWLGALNKTILQ